MIKRIKNYILVQKFDSELKTHEYENEESALHAYGVVFKSAKDSFDDGGYLYIHVGLYLSEIWIEQEGVQTMISPKKPSISKKLKEVCSFSLVSDSETSGYTKKR